MQYTGVVHVVQPVLLRDSFDVAHTALSPQCADQPLLKGQAYCAPDHPDQLCASVCLLMCAGRIKGQCRGPHPEEAG